MSWQLLMLISSVTYAFSVVFQRTVLKKEKVDALSFAIVSQLIITLLLAVYAAVNGHTTIPPLGPYIVPLLILAVCYGAGAWFFQLALKHGDAANFSVIFSLKAFVTTLAAFLLLKEVVLPRYLLGGLVILISIAVVTLKQKRIAFSRADGFALLAAVAYGVANTNDRSILQTMDLYIYMPICFLLPALAQTVFQPHKLKLAGSLFHSSIVWKFLSYCVLYTISAITFFASLQMAPTASQAVLLALSATIFVVLSAAIFLKERERLVQKSIGAVLSILGAMLLS